MRALDRSNAWLPAVGGSWRWRGSPSRPGSKVPTAAFSITATGPRSASPAAYAARCQLVRPCYPQCCTSAGSHRPRNTLEVLCPEVLKLEQIAKKPTGVFGEDHHVWLSNAL